MRATLPSAVKVVEVSPRDGLQNESQIISSATKIAFINQLSETGLTAIEVTGFVSPEKIPQLSDNKDIFSRIIKKNGISYSALIPNLIGFENARAAGVTHMAIFASASERFSEKNINCSIEDSLKRFEAVMTAAKPHLIKIRGYISCVLGCPYEGPIKTSQVAKIAKRLYEMGCEELSLGDTIGVGTPYQAKSLIEAVTKDVPREKVAMHFHDTYGQAIANILASLEEGIQIFDASVAGLGGCPYAKGATGNVATEEVVYLLQGLDIETGIDLIKLSKVGCYISEILHRPTQSKVARALMAKYFSHSKE